jgi:hypothetical protein
MSKLTFKAVIGGVHFDPKKGTVKIQLEATSYVSLDELTTLGPQDESIRITLESEQTRIDEHPHAPTEGDPATPDAVGIDEEGAERLKKAAEELRNSPFGVDDEPLVDLPRG